MKTTYLSSNHLLFSMVIWLSIISSKGYYIVDEVDSMPFEPKSLYSPSDNVVEVTERNMTEVTFGDSIWLLEFYNHWCGHCKRFVPTWISVANSLQESAPNVKVGALNCATSSSTCQMYQVSSTPTIKMFNPRATASQWQELNPNSSPSEFSAIAMNELRNYYPESYPPYRFPRDTTIPPPTFIPTETSTSVYTPVVSSKPDKVHQDDIEKAIHYSITKEIPMNSQIDTRALYQYLEALIKFTPNLRESTKSFLISLREWPQVMGFGIVTGKQFKDKVEELDQFYKPFAGTGKDYVYCKGSDSKYRGYPCSLWTLFHSLTVSAARDFVEPPYGVVNPVANAIRVYVENFFSCRDCANHFIIAANSIPYPNTDNDAVFWLWTLHNRANGRLAKDISEDPEYPKIQWPSTDNCPDCVNESIDIFSGTVTKMWNVPMLINYIKEIYSESNIEQNDLTPGAMTTSQCIDLLPVASQGECRAIFVSRNP